MVSKTGEAESITSHYLFALGTYRALYILNWIYRYYTEGFYDLIAIIAGIVQTFIYIFYFIGLFNYFYKWHASDEQKIRPFESIDDCFEIQNSNKKNIIKMNLNLEIC